MVPKESPYLSQMVIPTLQLQYDLRIGVQILNITNPASITATSSIQNSFSVELDGAWGITTFESGGHTYAAVTGYVDNGVQILNITNPNSITAVDNIRDTPSLELNGPRGITTFNAGGHPYVAVAAGDRSGDGVQILDVSNPLNVTAVVSISDSNSLELDNALGITTFRSGGYTYIAVAANADNGVQIIRIDGTDSDDTAAPVADAGSDRQVDEGGSITLQGSGSDPDGNDSDLTYSWSQDSRLSFDNSSSATPTVTASLVTANTTITLTLTVDDGTLSDEDTMVLTIQDVPLVNQAPSADAGSDRQVDEGGSITLQGSGSDPDGNDSDLTYSWSQDSRLSFDNSSSATPTVTASLVTANTTITLTLTVDDGTLSDEDTMVLTIQDVPLVNQAPSADAGSDRQVDEGGSITLQGSGSDPDGNDSDLTYSWSQDSRLSFDNSSSATPTVTASLVTANTTITLTLTVDDGTLSDEDTMVLTIQDVPLVNQAPSADAGSDRQVDEGGSITLQGSGSDPDGNDSDLTYSWSQDSRLSFDNSSSATPTVTASLVTANTTITLTLTVDDGTDLSDEDTMVLTIQDVPLVNQAPSADAGSDRQVDEGGSITLQGSGSDPDGNDSDLTYSWSQIPDYPLITRALPHLQLPHP